MIFQFVLIPSDRMLPVTEVQRSQLFIRTLRELNPHSAILSSCSSSRPLGRSYAVDSGQSDTMNDFVMRICRSWACLYIIPGAKKAGKSHYHTSTPDEKREAPSFPNCVY